MVGYTMVHMDDFERPFPKWALARKSLGLGSFGMNVVELPPGETIPEHTEVESDQEEVFIVLEGNPTMVIDGEDHPAPAGTFTRLDPEPRRRIFEPFFTTKTRGTGLGMAIVRRIVEAHGGRIAVGEGSGPGAEIIVTLPRGLP